MAASKAKGAPRQVTLPDRANSSCEVHTELSRKQLAKLYSAAGWEVRKCSFVDFEVETDWEELVIEAESPIPINGLVADVVSHADDLVSPLRAARVEFSAECYGPPPDRKLPRTLRPEL